MSNYYGYVYRITNLINGKTYIGQRRLHRDKDWEEYYGSGTLILQAIAKYGKANFEKTLVKYACDAQELDSLEGLLIKEEWEAGHGEYNQVAHVPSPDSWTRLPSGRLAEITILRLDSRKRYYLDNQYPSHARAEKAYKDFLENTDLEQLRKIYKETGSIKETAKVLASSKKRVYRYLKENDLVNPSRTIAGTPLPEAQKQAIKDGMLRTIYGDVCGICHKTDSTVRCKEHVEKIKKVTQKESACFSKKTARELHIEAKIMKIKELSDECCSVFFKLGSIRATALELGVDKKLIREILVLNGIPIPEQSTSAARKAVADSKTL